MGTAQGHFFPGFMIALLGVIYYLRAINIRFLRFMHRSKFWTSLRELLLVVFAYSIPIRIIGSMIEIADMIYHKSWASSHIDHLHMFGIIGFSGAVGLLHVHFFLKNSMWALVEPFGITCLGIMMAMHGQDEPIEGPYHRIFAMLLIMLGLSRGAEVFLSSMSNEAHFEAAKRVTKAAFGRFSRAHQSWLRLRDCVCCCSPCSRVCRPPENDLRGLHPMYSNPTLFRSPLPLLSSVLFVLAGLWFCDIGYVTYLRRDIWEHTKEEHYFHLLSMRLFAYGAIVLVSFVSLSFVLYRIDECVPSARKDARSSSSNGTHEMMPLTDENDDV